MNFVIFSDLSGCFFSICVVAVVLGYTCLEIVDLDSLCLLGWVVGFLSDSDLFIVVTNLLYIDSSTL